MFYTNKSRRILTRAIGYLELISTANNRAEYQRAEIARWDKAGWDTPLRSFYKREDFEDVKERYELLAIWLETRYEDTMAEWARETMARLPHLDISIRKRQLTT